MHVPVRGWHWPAPSKHSVGGEPHVLRSLPVHCPFRQKSVCVQTSWSSHVEVLFVCAQVPAVTLQKSSVHAFWSLQSASVLHSTQAPARHTPEPAPFGSVHSVPSGALTYMQEAGSPEAPGMQNPSVRQPPFDAVQETPLHAARQVALQLGHGVDMAVYSHAAFSGLQEPTPE
jgi:hypothetical protein